MLTKEELQRAVDALRPWHYCHIFPYGISSGDSLVPVQSEKLLLMLQAGAFAKSEYSEVLDLGSNSGLISMWFVDNRSSRVLAVEHDDRFYAQLELAIQAKGYSDKITPWHYDITLGDYGENQFDLVLFLGVLHHIEPIKQSAIFEAAFKALKPGGQMVVQTTKEMFVLQHLHSAGFKNCKQLKGYTQGDRLAWSGEKRAAKAS